MKPFQLLFVIPILLLSLTLQAQRKKSDDSNNSEQQTSPAVLTSTTTYPTNEVNGAASVINLNLVITQGFGESQDIFPGLDESTIMSPDELLIFTKGIVDEVVMHLNVSNGGILTSNLYDKSGKLIKQQSTECKTGLQEEVISFEKLNPGIYSLFTVFRDKIHPTRKTSYYIQKLN